MTYKVIDHTSRLHDNEPLVTVRSGGHVTAGSRSGEASLLIKSHEDFGVNQSLVILIKVKVPTTSVTCICVSVGKQYIITSLV